MPTRLILLLFMLSISGSSFSQSKYDMANTIAAGTVDSYLRNGDSYTPGRTDEYIILILEIDSAGKVSQIHVLGDNENAGPYYNKLKNMKPSNFKGDVFTKWKGMYITLPVYCLFGKENYVKNSMLVPSCPMETDLAKQLFPEIYIIPQPPKMQLFAPKIKEVDTVGKRN